MFTKSLISTERESILQVSKLNNTVIYTVKPTSLPKLVWKLIKGGEIQFVTYSKEGTDGRENSQD